ncbi:MAG: hypothetical protein GY852_07695 [bacterium]|nr:hypothetical protein [bacterium]
MKRRTVQTELRRQPIKASLKIDIPSRLHPAVDHMVGKTRFTLKTLRVLSTFFDDMLPTPELSPIQIRDWKQRTIEFFRSVEGEVPGQSFRPVPTNLLISGIREYANEVGKKEKDFRFQLLFLAATIETAVSPKRANQQ